MAWTLLTAAPAAAHAALASSNPSDGERLAALPSTVTLTFDEAVSTPAFVSVVGADGTDRANGPASVDGSTVTQAVTPSKASGAFTVSYRVVSDDGHPVTGTVDFSVGTANAAADANDSSTSFWDGTTIAIAVIAAVVVLALGALIASVRRTATTDAGSP
jgi:methionine-rich copper-binding protein CopC